MTAPNLRTWESCVEESWCRVWVSAYTEYALGMNRHCAVRWRYRNYLDNMVHMKTVKVRNCSSQSESVCFMQYSSSKRKRLKTKRMWTVGCFCYLFTWILIYQADIPQIPSALDELLEQTKTLSRIYFDLWLSAVCLLVFLTEELQTFPSLLG